MFKKLFVSLTLLSTVLATTGVTTVATLVTAVTPANAWAQKSASKSKDLALNKDLTGSITWTGYGVGKSHTGTIQVKSGKVEMKNEHVMGGNVVFAMNSLVAPDSKKLEGHLKSADFFDVEKYPEAKFMITQVEKLTAAAADGSTHKISGNLTIKIKTNPIDVMAKITLENNQWHAVGSTEIKDRTQYDCL